MSLQFLLVVLLHYFQVRFKLHSSFTVHLNTKRDNVFQSGPSKICRGQSLKKLDIYLGWKSYLKTQKNSTCYTSIRRKSYRKDESGSTWPFDQINVLALKHCPVPRTTLQRIILLVASRSDKVLEAWFYYIDL